MGQKRLIIHLKSKKHSTHLNLKLIFACPCYFNWSYANSFQGYNYSLRISRNSQQIWHYISPIHGTEPGWQNKSHFKPPTTCKFFFQFTSASKTILYTYNQSSNSHSMCCHRKWPHCPIFSPIIVYLLATKAILLLRSCSNVPQNIEVIFTDFFFFGVKWIDLNWNRSFLILHTASTFHLGTTY